MAFLRWFIGFVITICICAFAVVNRDSVSLSVNPITQDQFLELPLYVVFLGAMAFGFLFGGIIVWFNMSGLRKEKRTQGKEIKLLEKELERLKEEKLRAKALPAGEIFPALSTK